MYQVLSIFVHRHLFDGFDKSYFHLRCLVSLQLVAEEYYFPPAFVPTVYSYQEPDITGNDSDRIKAEMS